MRKGEWSVTKTDRHGVIHNHPILRFITDKEVAITKIKQQPFYRSENENNNSR